MPIRPELRIHYGRAWRREIRPRILERAGRRCERCSKPDRALVFTYSWKQEGEAHMIWIRRGSKVWRNQRGWPVSPLHAAGLPRKIRVILTVAHLNHDPADNRNENLAALCQWCHLHHDFEKHRDTRRIHKDARRPLLHVAILG